jgi:DNA polymerase III delta' subunit
LDDVQFQEAAIRMLRAAVAHDRVAHAYLFVGPRGVGKGRLAREFAKLLLCTSPKGGGADGLDSCGACASCGRIDRDTHPDLYWFRKEPDRNDFRIALVVRGRGEGAPMGMTVTESVSLHPMEGTRTVTVLDDAELLNRVAANALLKVLEEPPPHAVLILLCADASQLPSTILSRCQWVRFKPLPETFVAKKLAESIASRTSQKTGAADEAPARRVSKDEAAFVCHFAGGSVEQAEGLVRSGLWDLKRGFLPRLADMDEAAALDVADAIGRWSREQAKETNRSGEAREETALRRALARLALAAAASAFRDAAVEAGACGAAALTNADQPEVIKALAAWSADACDRAVGLLADAQEQIDRYVHTELATENALIQVARLRLESARI